MKINLTNLQRQIGHTEARIAHLVRLAERAEWRAEFMDPEARETFMERAFARNIRRVKLPALFTELHRLQAMLPPPAEIDLARLAAVAAAFDDRYRQETWSAAA